MFTIIAFPVSAAVSWTNGSKQVLWGDQLSPNGHPDSDVVDNLNLTLLVYVL